MTAREIIEAIADFDWQCADAERTDVEDVWDLFRWIRDRLDPTMPHIHRGDVHSVEIPRLSWPPEEVPW